MPSPPSLTAGCDLTIKEEAAKTSTELFMLKKFILQPLQYTQSTLGEVWLTCFALQAASETATKSRSDVPRKLGKQWCDLLLSDYCNTTGTALPYAHKVSVCVVAERSAISLDI